MLAGVLSFPTHFSLPSYFHWYLGQVRREEGGLGMLSGSGPSPWLLVPHHPSSYQCGIRAAEPLAAPGASMGCDLLFMGYQAKQPAHGGEREMKRKWRIHLLLTRCCLVTSAFCRLPLLVAPDGSMWLLKINHPPGRGAGERGEEVEMGEEENFFTVPALQHHGDAGKGSLPQGEKEGCSSSSMLDIILAFAPSCWLLLSDEQEVTSTWR